jgi:hypothetical protein
MRSPAEHALIDSEVRLGRSRLRLQSNREVLNQGDDRIRDTRHRRVTQDDETYSRCVTLRMGDDSGLGVILQ